MSFYIIIRGPLACGKSTIAKEIGKKIKAKYIAIDEIIEIEGLDKDIEQGYISQKSFIKANEFAIKEANKFLSKNKPVVFDGNFYWKSQIEDLIKRLSQFKGYTFTLKAPLEVCISRDIERGETHGEIATKVVYKKSTEFEYGIIIDVNKPLDKCVNEILSKIKLV